ncbi:hypothetical protein MIB92_19155 [Aestuariirhabdus sp. Z084]|uniref:hypothetical protein n=1 Tax=Aestuariirhabdus haliotis TaxID=2918751 RepID=UPI00201B385F|nr:hypothetical protein [Aestuariirhabdus haliotis]MCL6417785.1 hypothetical protein [Aestuariirhabdus haliotis]MCL6420214.1 hypothetical protein [Aestuariirhabdus haliotis]
MSRSKPFNFIESISTQRITRKSRKEHDGVAPLLKSNLPTHQLPAAEASAEFVRGYN